jgi:hypothetical protein
VKEVCERKGKHFNRGTSERRRTSRIKSSQKKNCYIRPIADFFHSNVPLEKSILFDVKNNRYFWLFNEISHLKNIIALLFLQLMDNANCSCSDNFVIFRD